MPETEPNSFRFSHSEFAIDPRGAAERLRALAAKQPPAKLDYAAELIHTAWELEFAAEEKEKWEWIAAAGVGV